MLPAKRILILDEVGFSKICSAMLSDDGYHTELVFSEEEAIHSISNDDIALIISSYPYALSLLRSEKVQDIPIMILSEEINNELIEMMKGFRYSVCMVKPLDFQRFKYLVHGIVNGYLSLKGGNIIA
jgi:DNA-binding response OmpR family regulator